ncbi:MAG: fructose-1,6-bisphosphatase [Eubacteriales bacterium]|nr:fructose-1,6-bisphosphatase [Eubacteriales bacterium]
MVQSEKYLKLLAREYPTITDVSTEIINLRAILCLPKGTEHFISDMHGEYAAFLHMLKNASGVVREKIDLLFGDTMSLEERNSFATLIYYPEKKLERLRVSGALTEEWYINTLLRLAEVCKLSASKYTRSKLRKALPRGFEYVIDELLHAADNDNKSNYNREIVRAIVETERADAFIVSISHLIQRLVIDRLHIIGDVYDRGPGSHIIMDALMQFHDIDFQWGNHDILWMGAAAGSDALIATTIINSLKYGNMDTLEDGYGISLSPLVTFALQAYNYDPCVHFYPRTIDATLNARDSAIMAKMHKAMAVILFKLEGDIIERNPDFLMDERRMLDKIDYQKGTITIGDSTYELNDKSFPTILPSSPYTLSSDEQELMDKLRLAFYHSQKLQEHVQTLYTKGSLYLRCNGNLLFHGCVPAEPDGEFTKVTFDGNTYSGKSYFDYADATARSSYFLHWGSPQRKKALDFMWYLWCGPNSPLFGKDRMTTFERYFIDDKSTHLETKNTYFVCAESEDFAVKLLKEFGIEGEHSRVINGHVPVKIKKGESPIKANGRVIVIDGGMSKPYQSTTGIAGYTLIYSSNGVFLSCHDPFVTVDEAIDNELDIHSEQTCVYRPELRIRVADTDVGEAIKDRIEDLSQLLNAYRTGTVKECSK